MLQNNNLNYSEKITGRIIAMIYRNESNGYSVYILKNGSEKVTIVGEAVDIEVGDEVELVGTYGKHKVYGTQFAFTSIVKLLPKGESELISYIADNVNGIGRKTAKKIVREFGEDTPNILKNNPELVTRVATISSEKLESLTNFFNNEWTKWNAIHYLASLGVSVMSANKIYESLKENTIDIIKENPYSILEYSVSIGFKEVDKIAISEGIDKNMPDRVCAGIMYSLSEVTEFGHTCIEKNILLDYATKLLEIEESEIKDNLANLVMNSKINIRKIDGEEFVFDHTYYVAEKNIAEAVRECTSEEPTYKKYEELIAKVSKKNNIELSKEQKKAITTCLNNQMTVITGGPGTGKTTIIKCIIDILEINELDYVLAAPTGRAAKRITETTGKKAKTLHRLLELTKLEDKDKELYLDAEVKSLDASVVIIDESSMIDTLMMNNIFKALNGASKLILVGDVNQLPSVGPGAVLKDIIDSEVVPTVFLKEIYRQSAESNIIVGAHMVNDGKIPTFKNKDTDLFFIQTSTNEEAMNQIESLIKYRLKNTYNIDTMTDLQVLTPTKKGEFGTVNLNNVIQNMLNPKSEEALEKTHKNRVFRVGDKVMQIVNNYDREFDENGEKGKGVFNGDVGYIINVDSYNDELTVVYDDNKITHYEFDALDELEHAYAITIHKSQGSEYPYVIVPLWIVYPKLFTRNLLYTAMTRAKKMLVLVGNKKIIDYMVNNVEEKNRKTGLKSAICSMFKF